jgi:hypothetical protein
MAYNITPLSGIALNTTTTTNTNSAGTAIPTFGPLGTQVFGSDGKRYVFVKTSGNVTANATVAVNSSTFVATYNATGDYTAPGTAAGTVLTDGTYVWVSKASV